MAGLEEVSIRRDGVLDYLECWQRMRSFTDNRQATSPDRIWCLQHPAVFTLGQAGSREHIIDPQGIPVVHTDRGGQVTYHGPGQLVVYLMIDLRRRHLGIRGLVSLIETALVKLLAEHGVEAQADPAAPGVYVAASKVAALGLRVRRGCSYHGLSLNVDMDLAPFGWINPCGYQGLAVTQTHDLGIAAGLEILREDLLGHLLELLAYNHVCSVQNPPGDSSQ